MCDTSEVEAWLAECKAAAANIDPETAEVHWRYAQVVDPYGVDCDISEECYCVGRMYFARAPGSDVWVWFGDLPKGVAGRLWERGRKKKEQADPFGDIVEADNIPF